MQKEEKEVKREREKKWVPGRKKKNSDSKESDSVITIPMKSLVDYSQANIAVAEIAIWLEARLPNRSNLKTHGLQLPEFPWLGKCGS